MWRRIEESDLQSAINSVEDTTFRNKLLTESQEDPYGVVFSQVTFNFREAIRSNPANALDPDPATLPEAAIFHAVAYVRHRLMGRFSTSEISEIRRDEYKAATQYLSDITGPKGVPVEQPFGSESAKSPLPSPAVNQSPRRDGWRNQDGI